NPVAQNCDASQLLFCDPGTSLCKTWKTASAGGTCGLSFLDASFTVCTAGANCKTATGSTTGTCEAPAADGAMCDGPGMTGPKCFAPAVCANGACKIPDPASCR
ncbi:MAG: hypothetical protein M3O46_13840, partial [Myxococcota bacterium]|nr:hypothetical protein [Myxococcota bacterium]